MKVIIVGAGMAGLMAARILCKSGIEVLLLEACDVAGGRAKTVRPKGFECDLAAGAEFIHGHLPITLELLKEAGIGIKEANQNMFRADGDKLKKDFKESPEWLLFYNEINALAEDCSVETLLERTFSADRFEGLRAEVREMASGLDLAKTQRLSVYGIREEWQSDEIQYRPVGGYGALNAFFISEIEKAGGTFRFNAVVNAIYWAPRQVSVEGEGFAETAEAVIVTIPLGQWLGKDIAIVPEISGLQARFRKLGFGSVIKIPLWFDNPFWLTQQPDLGFLFTPAGYTFWTLLPDEKPLLTAWMGNDRADDLERFSEKELIAQALEELAKVFEIDVAEMGFRAGAVFKYTKGQFSKGGYSWPTVKGASEILELLRGIENTLWFAGEAFAPNGEVGTVEAALWSGKQAAQKILSGDL